MRCLSCPVYGHLFQPSELTGTRVFTVLRRYVPFAQFIEDIPAALTRAGPVYVRLSLRGKLPQPVPPGPLPPTSRTQLKANGSAKCDQLPMLAPRALGMA